MTIYGIDFYGTNTYGVLPFVEFDASPFLAEPYGYGTLRLRWNTPSGDWDRLRVVRNGYGAPDFESDGFILPIDPAAQGVNEYLDRDLREGSFYYYSIFVRETATTRWIQAATAIGLVSQDFGYGDQLFSWVPGWFQEQDEALGTAPSFEGPLQRYLRVVGLAADFTRTELETLRWTRRPEQVSGNLLPLMAQQFGVPIEPAIGTRRTRFWLRDAAFLARRRGTLTGIQGIVTTITGWASEVRYGPNLLRGVCAAAWYPDDDASLEDLFASADLTTGDIHIEIETSEPSWTFSNAPLDGSAVVYHGLPVTAGEAYTFEGSFLPAATGEVELEISWFDEDFTLIGSDSSGPEPVSAGGDWTRVSVSEFSPGNAAYAVVTVRGDVDAEIRHLQFVRGDVPPAWTAPKMLEIELLPVRTNYVGNPSFEQGVLTWSISDGAIARTETMSVSGTASLVVTAAGAPLVIDGGGPDTTFDDAYDGGDAAAAPTGEVLSGAGVQGAAALPGSGFAILTGGPYPIELPEVQHAVRLSVSNPGSRARVRWLSAGSGTLAVSPWRGVEDPTASAAWHTILFASFPPAGTAQVAIEIEVSENTHVDAVLIEAADTPGPYFDGSTFGGDYVWGGAAHRSASRFYPRRAERNARLRALLPNYLPVNQVFQLQYVESGAAGAGLLTTGGAVGVGTLGEDTLGLSE